MQLRAAELAQFRAALEAVEPSAFGLRDVRIYPGASPYCARSVVACRFGPDHRESLHAAFEQAALSASARLGIELGWGMEPDTTEPVFWIEYFPGGIRRSSADFALHAVRAALAAAAAEGSGMPEHESAALREAGRFEQASVPPIFVQSRFLIAAARRAGIPVEAIAASDSLWRFGWGRRSDIFFGTASLGDSFPGHQITWKKTIAKALFHQLGLPTPAWRVVRAGADPLRLAEQLGWPCAVKPVDQAFGRGVTANVTNATELKQALAVAGELSRSIMIEAHQPGWDHRLMVVDGRLVAAARREPPKVAGDGTSTVAELVAQLNAGRDGTREKGYLLPVEWDAEVDAMLARRQLTATSILPPGETVALRSIANFSTGGSAEDVMSLVHPQIRRLAELLATSVGLRTAGIDYITPDIGRSYEEVGGGFIEANAMPRLRLLMADGQGEADITALLLGERPGRIPVTLVAASADSIAAIGDVIKARVRDRQGAAAVSPLWAHLGATALPDTGLNAFERASALLRHAEVDELMILWSAEQIEEFGLPVDALTRAIVVNDEIEHRWLAPYCRKVVAADGPEEAIAALTA